MMGGMMGDKKSIGWQLRGLAESGGEQQPS